MSLPTVNDVHVNRPLTDEAVAYAQKAEAFFADRLAPLSGSKNKSNSFFKFTKDYWSRDAMARRAAGADAALVGYGITTDEFNCGDPWAAAHPIDEQEIANQDDPLDAEKDAMAMLMQIERIRRDNAFATTCLSTGTWASDIQGVNSGESLGTTVLQWDDANSTPVEDVSYYKIARKKATGQDMNVFAVGAEVHEWLKIHPDILARITGGSNNGNPALVTKALLAAIFEVEEYVVMDSIVNTAAENATFSGSFIAGKKALLMLRNAAKGPRTVTAVKTFTWEGYTGNKEGVRALTYPKPPHATMVEIESAFVHKVVAADCGVLFYDLVP